LPEPSIAPRLRDTDKVVFTDSHRPPLDDGDYTVTVEHDVKSLGIEAERTFTFIITGPRFALPPDAIAARFPPAAASGDFAHVLPHVLLNRATLPWERTAIPGDDADAPPWLALLVFTEAELAGRTRIVEAKELLADAPPQQPGSRAKIAKLHKSSADDPEAPVTLLDLDGSLANDLLPRVDELALMAANRNVDGRPPRAFVMANRLPIPASGSTPQRNIVHLVSLERQYLRAPGSAEGEDWSKTHRHWAAGGNHSTVSVISLANWSFDCAAERGDLEAILKAVEPGGLALESRSSVRRNPGIVDLALLAGAVPVEARLATGGRTAGWYHGPLGVTAHRPVLQLPARRPEELLHSETETGMPDLSYAAAWELGRLLALSAPEVGGVLYQWKRQLAHAGHAARGREAVPELHDDEAAPASPLFTLHDWFETALARLESVPFTYLVPDPVLLPPESLRFFILDNDWLACLFDGALSIGRTSEAERLADRERMTALPQLQRRSGILLRSAAVAGWPDLEIDGFDPTSAPLETIRKVRLDRETLLVLFAGEVLSVAVHPHPEAMHFGVEADSEGKLAKNGQSVEPRPGGLRVLDIGGLATSFGSSGAHDFARAMLEGVPKVTFTWGASP